MWNATKKKWLASLPKRISSAALILENSAQQALIVKANYKPYWTFPGGIIDPGETPKEAAVREVYEEVGLKVPLGELSFVAIIDRKSSIAQTYQFVFKAKLKPGAIHDIVLQAIEIDECALVTKTQVLAGDREYAKAVRDWANDITGYSEQQLGKPPLL